MSFVQSFDDFVTAYAEASNDENLGNTTEYAEVLPSPCFIDNSPIEGQMCKWRSILRDTPGSMKNLEKALEISIHPDVHELFGRYYSLDLNASAQRGHLSILQALNEEDFERFQKNLIAHVLMKRRLKLTDTLFFALTDQEDFLLSVIPQTGQVVLEIVGREHHEIIADNLKSFFENISPDPQRVYL